MLKEYLLVGAGLLLLCIGGYIGWTLKGKQIGSSVPEVVTVYKDREVVKFKDKSTETTTVTKPDGTVIKKDVKKDVTGKKKKTVVKKTTVTKQNKNKFEFSFAPKPYLKWEEQKYQFGYGRRIFDDIWLEGKFRLDPKDLWKRSDLFVGFSYEF